MLLEEGEIPEEQELQQALPTEQAEQAAQAAMVVQ
jgi:hypothetical protein